MAVTHQQTHEAGRHLAVAQALLRGYAAKTIGRSSLVEINGHRAQVQVAAKGSWQIQDVEKYLSGTIELVVLVDISGNAPEYYIVPGDRLRASVKRRYDAFISRVGTRPRNPQSKHSRIDPSDVRRWRNRWALFD